MRSPRFDRLSLLSIAAGATAAAAFIAVGGGAASPRPADLRDLAPQITVANNKVRLDAGELRTLLRWAQRVQRCMNMQEPVLAAPALGESEILMPLRKGTHVAPNALVERSMPCVQRAPPLKATFAYSRGLLRVYRPRACLLPTVPRRA